MAFRYIAIEGPIGVGKTRLAERLANRIDGSTVLGDLDNPFLAAFYNDRPGSALQAQLFFLLSRHRQLTALRQAVNLSLLVMNPRTWRSISAQDQATIAAVSTEARQRAITHMRAVADKGLADLKKALDLDPKGQDPSTMRARAIIATTAAKLKEKGVLAAAGKKK